MRNMNVLGPDRVKNEISVSRNNNDAHVRFVDLAPLIGCVCQVERPVKQAGNDTRCSRLTVIADIRVNALKIFESRPCQADFHPA